MAAKSRSLSLFLLLLLTFQEMISSDAALCEAPSRFFKGLCISSKNCLAICEKDGFQSGECKRLKCVCAKDCNTAGGDEPPPSSGGDEPGEGPPTPGGDEPAGEGPPAPGGDEPGEGPTEDGGEEIIESKADVCPTPNKVLKRCFRNKKCLASCVKQGFISGTCKRFKCVCAKKCNADGEDPPVEGGDGSGEVPSEGPPEGGEGGKEPAVHSRKYMLN